MRAFVAIGSNIEPEANILRALRLLAEQTSVRAVSRFYRTAAIGRPDDPAFLNGACALDTELPAERLKRDVLRRIEDATGRLRTADAYAPRTMDLDIAAYGEQVDPDVYARAFLARALYDLAPELVLADTGARIADVVRRFSDAPLEIDELFTRTAQEMFAK